VTPTENPVIIVGGGIAGVVFLQRVHDQLVDWFGAEVRRWRHLKTYRISHALPDQSPPTRNPACPVNRIRSGIFVCGEYGSLPGIQWALLSGRRTADAVQAHLRGHPI
jgi:hypothetical protein